MARRNKNRKDRRNEQKLLEEQNIKQQDQKSEGADKEQNIQKNLEEIFGNVRISETLEYTEEITIKNRGEIPFCLVKNSPKGDRLKIPTDSIILTSNSHKSLEDYTIDVLNKARMVVCVSSWLFQNNSKVSKKLFELSERGIRIYLTLASESSAKKVQDSEDVSHGYNQAKDHVDFLNEASKGYMYIRTGELHAKFVLIDPNTDNSQGILLTANLTIRGLTENKEVGVLLNDSRANELFLLFLQGFYTEAKHGASINQSQLKSLRSENTTLVGKKTESVLWSSRDSFTIKDELLRLLKRHRRGDPLIISSWNIIDDQENEITKEILNLTNENTRILIPNTKKNYPFARNLIEKGAQIRCNKYQHAKFIISGNRALIFSANFEVQGLYKGFEAGIKLENPQHVKNLLDIFDFWYDNAETDLKINIPIEKLANKEFVSISVNKNTGEYSEKSMVVDKTSRKTPVNITIPIKEYMDYKMGANDPKILENFLVDRQLLSAEDKSIETIIPLSIRFPIARDLNYIGQKDKFHIWESKNPVQGKTKCLVINFDPLKNRNLYQKAANLAEKENCRIILY